MNECSLGERSYAGVLTCLTVATCSSRVLCPIPLTTGSMSLDRLVFYTLQRLLCKVETNSHACVDLHASAHCFLNITITAMHTLDVYMLCSLCKYVMTLEANNGDGLSDACSGQGIS
ncbi:hypothetical protein ABBQ32_009770 [Trebouxia sp. C0010 RCD-2024]